MSAFEHANKFWKAEMFKNSINEWKEVRAFVSDEKTKYKCKICKTYWKDNNFICSSYPVCSMCDTYVQPYFSNPINAECVRKYIDSKYWEYIFEETETEPEQSTI